MVGGHFGPHKLNIYLHRFAREHIRTIKGRVRVPSSGFPLRIVRLNFSLRYRCCSAVGVLLGVISGSKSGWALLDVMFGSLAVGGVFLEVHFGSLVAFLRLQGALATARLRGEC